MPLFNICAVTGNNKTIQIGLVFMSREKQADYKWALGKLKEVMTELGIPEPTVVVTDRELALMNALDALFLCSDHILCRWHVNMNVLAKCKKHFPGPKKVDGKWRRHAKFAAFLQEWNVLLHSPTEELYTRQLAEFKKDGKHPLQAVLYCERTWLCWKEKLVFCYVDKHLHFGYLVTSSIEGCHAGLKKYLKYCTAGLEGVYLRLLNFWEDQQTAIADVTSRQVESPRHAHRKKIFTRIMDVVHSYALDIILKERAKIPARGQPPPDGCTCTIWQSLGLPCFHTIFARERSPGYL